MKGALALIAGAVLDVNVRGEMAYPVAIENLIQALFS